MQSLKYPALLLGLFFSLALLVPQAHALDLTLFSAGEEEREDSSILCLSEPDFLAGLSTAGPLRVGGDTDACDSEWGFSLEFDLTPLQGTSVSQAHLLLYRNMAGYAYQIGVFGYVATGGIVSVPRADLNSGTDLATFSSSGVAGPEVVLDLTAAVQAQVDSGATRMGLFVAPLSSQVGNQNYVLFEGADSANPPALIIGPLAPQPNLTASMAGDLIAELEALPGTTVSTSSWQLQNTGDASATGFRVSWYLSTDPELTSDDQLLESFQVMGLDAQADTMISGGTLTLPAETPRGQIHLGVIVDDQDQVAESDEEDNLLQDAVSIGTDLVSNTTLTLSGASERETSTFPCLGETGFTAGVASPGPLLVGGNTDACDSEWGASLEFDLSSLSNCAEVDSAVLLLRQLSHFPWIPTIGIYEYTQLGSPTTLLRTELTPGTALATFTPSPSSIADHYVDVTAAVQSAIDGEFSTVRLFLVSTTDASDNDSVVEFDGMDGALPPLLAIYCAQVTAVDNRPNLSRGNWLAPCHPNPFNPSTAIRFRLAEAGDVELEVYDLAGRRVRTLVHGFVDAGVHERNWDGRDETGDTVASGVYMYRLRAGEYVETRRMVLLK